MFTTIVAAFFGDHSTSLSRPPDVNELARRAGMSDVQPLDQLDRRALGLHEPDRVALFGQWGAFGDAWAIVDRLKRHDCLQIYASQNTILDAEPWPPAENESTDDPMLPFIRDFRDACLTLQPIVAFLDTRSHYGDERWQNKQGNRDWVLGHYEKVLDSDTDALADERFSLLYLSDSLTRRWTSTPTRDDRDMVEVPSGRLVFAQSGPDRMA